MCNKYTWNIIAKHYHNGLIMNEESAVAMHQIVAYYT